MRTVSQRSMENIGENVTFANRLVSARIRNGKHFGLHIEITNCNDIPMNIMHANYSCIEMCMRNNTRKLSIRRILMAYFKILDHF